MTIFYMPPKIVILLQLTSSGKSVDIGNLAILPLVGSTE